jgi:general secretion pathway protein A
LYQQHFHFTELPFSIAPDPHFIYMSERHQEGLAHLLYGMNMGGGFVALTGEVGTGKTTLCRCLLEQLPANIDIALILNPKLNAIELLSTICDELCIAYDSNQQTLKHFIDIINQHLLSAYSNGRRTVLLIDEAQNLSLEVLEQIRLLTNLETSKTKLLQIILVGQPELKELLHQKNLRQLNQRITARYHLLPLSFAETRAYIRHRLMVCNGDPNLFKDRAIRKIYQFSSGIPRLINIICDRALLGAYATGSNTVTPEIITRAARETLDLGNRSRRWEAVTALILICGVITGGYYISRHPFKNPRTELIAPVLSPKPDLQSAIKSPEPEIVVKAEQPAIEPTAEVIAFKTWIDNPELTFNAAAIQALQVWNKAVPADNRADCQYVAAVGLHCLFAKAKWNDLLMFDRPVVMEFLTPSAQKHYALLIGVNKGQPVFRFNGDFTFPLNEVLDIWRGYYMLPWQSPRPSLKELAPAQLSNDVLWLRQQLSAAMETSPSAEHPLYFDPPLKTQVIDFQRLHHLNSDGIVGARTLIHLDNATGATNSPHLQITD